jgi:fructokinase
MLRVGIDLGGTKIEGIALDGSREVARLRVVTPRGDYAATLEAIAHLVGELEQRAGAGCRSAGLIRPAAIGIGIPGTLASSTGLVKNANSTWLIGKPLREDLAARLGREVRLANDANCFAVSEAADGAGAGATVVFGVIVGTGTGAGIVVSGQLLTGPNGIAGEWGHNPLPWPDVGERPGRECYCGRSGCIETFLSGPGLVADAGDEHRGATAAQVVAAASAGDAAAEAALRRYEGRMARALAHVINILDPDVIVLGGGMSKADRLYPRVPQLWGRFVFSDTVRTRLVPAVHGDASGVRGAAWLWPVE